MSTCLRVYMSTYLHVYMLHPTALESVTDNHKAIIVHDFAILIIVVLLSLSLPQQMVFKTGSCYGAQLLHHGRRRTALLLLPHLIRVDAAPRHHSGRALLRPSKH